MKKLTFEDYEKLCDEIWFHNRKYNVEHQPVITDEEYDQLFRNLEEIEKEHPEWILPTSPTQRVGETLTAGFKTIEHKVPMLSLANTYSKDEIADFIKRIHKLLEKKELAFSCELKMDGIAISATYHKGSFVQAVTRGDGKRGDDITANLKTVENLPLRLYGHNIPDVLELRGEAFMPHKAFKDLNEAKAKNQEALWANPRNAAAGSLKLLDPREVAKRHLSVVFYGIADYATSGIAHQFEVHEYLRSLGLPTLHLVAKCHTLDEIWEYAEKVRSKRKTLEYDIDGVVIKLDNLKDQAKLGATGKNPRSAIAYKFAALQATTHVLDIAVQVGRTGTLTPVAELEPVFLAGSTIARATLHNQDEIQRKDIRVGDLVVIEKGGDVIPKVVEVNVSARPHGTHPWHMPKKCPSCGTAVVQVEGEVAVRCPNAEHCPEQRLRRLIYFAGKSAMDIEHLGEKNVEQLFNKGFVKFPSDIYRLTEEQLYQLEGFKEKSVNNLLQSLEKSKDISLEKFIMALGIRHVGTGTAELLAKRAGDIETLSHLKIDDLLQIDGIGDIVAHSVYSYFADKHNQEEIKRLLEYGVKPRTHQVKIYKEHLFNGKIFVLTGTLHDFTRNAAAALIKERGGQVTDSVSKKTNYVLAGESPGSKLEKAHSLGIPVLTEEQFKEML